MEIIKAENLGIFFQMRRVSNKRSLLDGKVVDKRIEDDKLWALRNINFSINRGDILGVIGSNGSGKSTLLRLISGVYVPDEGNIEVNGNVSALLSLGAGFKNELTGLENIYLNGVILGFKRSQIAAQVDNIIEFSELGRFIHEPVKNYSSGMKSRLGFSISSYLDRDIMLIDEILGVGDFKFKKKSQDKMQEMIQDGKTVVIVSHNLDSIERYANKAIWINKGVLEMKGAPQEVIDAYLNS